MNYIKRPMTVKAWQYNASTFKPEELPEWLQNQQVTITDSCLVVNNNIFCYDTDYLVEDSIGLFSMEKLPFELAYASEEEDPTLHLYDLENRIEKLAKELNRRKPTSIPAERWKLLKKQLKAMIAYRDLLVELN